MQVTQAIVDALPDLDPIIAHEATEDGWRGLTENGEIVEVRSRGPNKPIPPTDPILVMRAGKPIGYRAVKQSNINIGNYLERFAYAADLFRRNELEAAIEEANAVMGIAPTLHARYNRAFMLLSAGDWRQGFADYDRCEQGPPFQRPQCKAALAAGLKPWQGEVLTGQRLLAVHAHGFGDTIMCLRYVARLRAQGIDVVMQVPPELARLASQVGPVTANSLRVLEADYFCPMLMLPHFCGAHAPSAIARNIRLQAPPPPTLEPSSCQRIGIAWSVGKFYNGDYLRAIPLAELVAAFPDAELHSIQIQDAQEAAALGVRTHDFEDFTDCAALMMAMDAIVTVDTAAAHLAGALEHPNVFLLLSHWHSWRWLAPWYPTMKICRQQSPDDWASALGQIHGQRGRSRLDHATIATA